MNSLIFNKVFVVLKRYFSPLYWIGGTGFIYKFSSKSGRGYYVLFKSQHKAFRVKVIENVIESIDVWTNWKPNKKPNYTVFLESDFFKDQENIIKILKTGQLQEHIIETDTVKTIDSRTNDTFPKRDLADLFGRLQQATKIVLKKIRPSLIITGGPGTGKTHSVMEEIKRVGLSEGKDYVVIKGKITTAALYKQMFISRKSLLIFDDTDSVWDNDDSANILKAALDTSPIRKVSWVSKLTVNLSKLSPEKKLEQIENIEMKLELDPTVDIRLPSEFNFEGQVIFISNKEREQIDSAVLSRSLHIDITLSENETLERIQGSIEHMGNKNVSVQDKQKILKEIMVNRQQGKTSKPLTLRMFISLTDIFASGDPEWNKMIPYV